MQSDPDSLHNTEKYKAMYEETMDILKSIDVVSVWFKMFSVVFSIQMRHGLGRQSCRRKQWDKWTNGPV